MKSSGGIGVQGQELCNSLVSEAVRLGADEAEVYYTRSRKLEVVFEKNDLQVPKGDNYEGVGIRVIRNRKQGFASTNILSRESLDDTLRSALAISDASPPTPIIGCLSLLRLHLSLKSTTRKQETWSFEKQSPRVSS